MTEVMRMAKATLEMELQERAPEGALTSADGRRLSFAGWTELASAIEEWRAEARHPGGDPGKHELRVPAIAADLGEDHGRLAAPEGGS